LTNNSKARTLADNLGFLLKHLRWTVVILGLSFVSLASIIPRADDPGTAFNETDAPINLTTPVVAQVNYVVPTRHFVAIPREQRVGWKASTMMHQATQLRRMRTSHSLLNLLCELLC
jgi:hypothetical protein